MKNTLVRSFALVLVVAGFSASSISSASVTKHVAKAAPLSIVSSPTPMCRLGSPEAKLGCGLD